MQSGEHSRGSHVVVFGRIDERGRSQVGPDGNHGHGFETDDSDPRVAEMAQSSHFFRSEGDVLAAEFVRFFYFYLLHGSCRVVGHLRCDSRGDLGLFAIEPDVTAAFWFLALEYYVASYGNLESRANLEREV